MDMRRHIREKMHRQTICFFDDIRIVLIEPSKVRTQEKVGFVILNN